MIFVYKLVKIRFINYVLLNSIYNFTHKMNIYIIKILQQLSLVIIFYNNRVDNFFLFLIHWYHLIDIFQFLIQSSYLPQYSENWKCM